MLFRRVLHRNSKLRILVIGDSHTRVFEHPLFLLKMPRVAFEIAYVPGATAYGLLRANSKTQARQKFDTVLATMKADHVLICLGEVDTAFILWKKAEQTGEDVSALLNLSVARYRNYLNLIHEQKPLTVLSAPLPTVPDQSLLADDDLDYRRAIDVSWTARTNLTLEFNRRIQEFCERKGIDYISTDEVALGGENVVKKEWRNKKRLDHHYARYPYAQHLISELSKRKLGKAADCHPDSGC